jgi:hypothetical protein
MRQEAREGAASGVWPILAPTRADRPALPCPPICGAIPSCIRSARPAADADQPEELAELGPRDLSSNLRPPLDLKCFELGVNWNLTGKSSSIP